MLIELLAEAGSATPQTKFGFWEAMQQGGVIAWFIFSVLVIMSAGSFYILITKLLEQRKINKEWNTVKTQFWRAPSLQEGAKKLDANGAWRQLVDDALKAEAEASKLTDATEAHDWMHGSLQRSEDTINAKLNGGLSFLATVGATAPFVGLLGTVIGIYRALINIGLAGSASIDKVAGPVGEALIMTAIGLLVAVPAVLAYNWLQARNKRIAERMKAFATDLLAYLSSNGQIEPSTMAKPAVKSGAKTTAKPAAAKA